MGTNSGWHAAVWNGQVIGIGESRDAAREDARLALVELDPAPHIDEVKLVPVDDETAVRIQGGETDPVILGIDAEIPAPCNGDVFRTGASLLAAETGPVGGAALFEKWVVEVAAKSGQRVDWHYSGGIAHVLVLGDREAAKKVAESTPLPKSCRILRWFDTKNAGLYRAGVTPTPEGAIGAFMNPDSGATVFMGGELSENAPPSGSV